MKQGMMKTKQAGVSRRGTAYVRVERRAGKWRTGFNDTIDYDTPACGPEKTKRVDLGLELLARRCEFGQVLTYQEIAAWAGCTDAAIYQIEKRALRKLRHARLAGVFKDLNGK
jgi:hypothetical protein